MNTVNAYIRGIETNIFVMVQAHIPKRSFIIECLYVSLNCVAHVCAMFYNAVRAAANPILQNFLSSPTAVSYFPSLDSS